MTLEYPWYFVLFCLLLGALYAGVMYYAGRNRFSRRLQWLLATLRALAVSATAFLLLAPMVQRMVHERQRPLVVLADDRSLSVAASADSAFALHELGGRLEGDFRVVYTSNSDNPAQTDLGALMEVPRDAAALVLASDGIYNRGQNPATVAERLGVPVYTVALGDTTPRCDAALTHLRANRIAYLGRDLTVEVTVNATQLAGRSTVLAAGRTQLPIEYTDNHFSSTFTLTLPCNEAGMQLFELRLKPLDGEETLENNRLRFYVDVIDDQQKVAIIGAAPHPDLAALKRAVEATDGYEANVMTAGELAGKRVDRGEYSLAILHNLPTATLAVPEAVATLPQVFVVGMQTDLPRFNALKTGMEIVSRAKKATDYTATYNDGFTLFHYDRADGEALSLLPPLTAPFGEARLGEGVQSLLTARLGNIDTRQPLVAATSHGGRRRAFIWGEGLWRWRLNDYLNNQSHEHFDRLMAGLVNFTAQEEGRERFRVESERVYPAGQNVSLRAQLYNEAYEPVNTPEAKLTLQGDSAGGDYDFSRQGDGYALSLGALPEGTYRYRAATTLDGQTLTAEGSFAIEALHLEQANLTADHTLLRTMSALSGGRMFYPHQVPDLLSQLSDIKPVIHTHTRHSELVGLPLVLALLLLLLAAEWVLRKYHGEI